ncbi:integrase [Paenibacillus sp. HB172176]|uniref:phage lytic cycle repressor MrpR family protein n=1 Tax=Paenibacillus sp. HB172176 TaxID=2493690 RepID=UPI00143AA215|nr:integrase [Paenibacillus sp. HB172176]
MSNILYEDKLYNEKVKEEFMSNMKLGSKKIFSRLFKISYPLETQLNKDLYDFSRDELTKFFYLIKPASKQSSAGNVGYVQKYIVWAEEEGYKTGLNPLDFVDAEWKKQFYNESVKRFWTEQELDQIIDSRENAQDAILIELLRSGVRGSGNSEILNLNRRSVDKFNNQLYLEDDNGMKRTVTVSEKCIKLCLEASNETEYSKLNGNASPDIKAPTAHLIDNEFILRNANTRTVHKHEAEKSIVHRRLDKIATELDIPNFTPLNISRSGMMQMAKEKILKYGKLTDEDCVEIAFQFGEKSDAALYRMKNDFLNENKVRMLYELL